MASVLNSTGYRITSSNVVSTLVQRDASGNFSANNPTFAGLSFSGSALSGTTPATSFDGTYTKGNYINIGGNGRNIGIANNGPLFLTYNLDYNASTNQYVYNSTNPGFLVILGTSSGPLIGQLSYAVSGTSGTNATISNAITWDTSGDVTFPSGSLLITTAGKGINIKGGSNARVGTGAVLSGGTVTVSTTAVATGDIILLSCTAAGGTQGIPRISAISSGTSFTITSSNGADTSTYSWVIVRPT